MSNRGKVTVETYTVNIDGYAFDHGLTKRFAYGLKELLSDMFPGASLVVIREL